MIDKQDLINDIAITAAALRINYDVKARSAGLPGTARNIVKTSRLEIMIEEKLPEFAFGLSIGRSMGISGEELDQVKRYAQGEHVECYPGSICHLANDYFEKLREK